MVKSAVKYGNVELGQINKILISLVGESAFYFYCEKYKDEWNLNWQSDGAFKKYIGRLLREEDCDYIGLNPDYENSVYQLAGKIFLDFEKNLCLPSYYVNAINTFVSFLYENFLKVEYPICETYYFFEIELYKSLIVFIKEAIETLLSYNHSEYTVFTFSSALEKYQFVFESVAKLNKFKNKEKFYEKLAEWCTERNKGENPENYKVVEPEHFKKIIALCVNNAKNPSWKNMQDILDFFASSKETEFLKSFLIEAYICSNIENLVRKESALPSNLIEAFFKGLELIKNNNIDSFETYIKYNMHFDFPKEKVETSVKIIETSFDGIFKKHIYLEDENQTELLIEDVKNTVPYALDFYCNWMRAYIELAKGNISGAQNLYKKAFEARRFAGSHFSRFIKQAFALSVYADSNSSTVRESIDPAKKSISPLPKDAKKYWSYGYVVGVFEKGVEDTYLEYFHKDMNFISAFPVDMFFENAKQKINLFSNSMGAEEIVFINEDFEACAEKDYQKLCKLTNQNINNRVRMYNCKIDNKISPISLALYHASQSNDKRFIYLLKDWLGLSGEAPKFDNIDVNLVSDAGVTPVSAAIFQYKLLRFREKELDEKSLQNMNDFKQIALKLIEMSSLEYLNVESKKTFRHPLQEAIESYDIEIVKAILEKGLNINGLKISADDCSPVYYTLMRIVALKNPSDYIEQTENRNLDSNINWSKLNIPGFSTLDKMSNCFLIQEKFNSVADKNDFRNLYKTTFIQEYGIAETYENQLLSLKNICLYLIEQTDSQDEFILRNKITNESWTSLYYAVETDDVDICRKLIEKEANPNLNLSISLKSRIPNTFLYRCIEFKAWNVLEMYLTEFLELAKISVNDYDNQYRFTPLAYFLFKTFELKNTNYYKGFSFVNKIYDLFLRCGANPNIPSTFGNAKELLAQFSFL